MISSSLSSMNAHALWNNNSASNIANLNSTDYKAIDTNLQENASSDGTVATTVRTSEGADIAQEMAVEQIPSQRGYDANAVVIKSDDEMQKTLLDMKA